MRSHRARRREVTAGWLFTMPAIIALVVFLVVPIVMAAWVSVSDWTGIGSPISAGVRPVGMANYEALLTQPGLAQQDLGLSIRDNLYYVLFVVPLQTALALLLAIVVSRKALRGRGFFRTAFYFPSVTSSVAVSMIFLFLFADTGVINAALGYLGAAGPSWFTDPSGLLHMVLGGIGITPPSVLIRHGLLGLSWWGWLAGPSVAMVTLIVLAIWTTSGTFMLLFLPALYGISEQVLQAAIVDGASAWTRFRRITLPLIRPALFLVLTLGLIGTWQVFDQVFLITQGNPAGTTLTPAYLAYQVSFGDQQWGQGAAIAFILFAIIVTFTVLQRLILRERGSATQARGRLR
ncbi:MAG TPA: sugar ABC transporter permease [Streptosporangiaceae bacterium]|nr:sugar ABC transporter permease [Streptosporangiaceae bacterium]